MQRVKKQVESNTSAIAAAAAAVWACGWLHMARRRPTATIRAPRWLAGWLPCRAARVLAPSTHPPVETSVDVVRLMSMHAMPPNSRSPRTVRVHALATAGPDSDSRDRHGVRCPLSTLAEEVTGTAWRPCYLLESGLPPAGAAVRCLAAPVGRRRPWGSFCSRFARPSTAVSVSETHLSERARSKYGCCPF